MIFFLKLFLWKTYLVLGKSLNGGKLKEVLHFESRFESSVLALSRMLAAQQYKHGPYYAFYINDPKQRHIHKAAIIDRIVHHAVFTVLNPIFESTFIYNSYSCRIDKGTHKGVHKLHQMVRVVSHNNTRPCHILKCDIKKFFQSVDHSILTTLISKKIKDKLALWLMREIIESFPHGIPIGNLTSQLFANIYLNELDKYVKSESKIPFYIRYTDDFVIIHENKDRLLYWLEKIKYFLKESLALELHPKKIIFRKLHQGIDFLGYVQFPHHRNLRHKTKLRILQKVAAGVNEQSLQSYLGVLKHANSFKLSEQLKNSFWLKSIEFPPNQF